MRNRVSWIGLASLMIILAMHERASAKRVVPAPVPSVVVGGIEYRVTHFPVDCRMGFIEAWDIKTKSVVWARQIYVVVKDPIVEGDVQDVFITKLDKDGGALIITNEIGFIYRLDLKSLEVTVVKGKMRVRR